MDPVTNPYAPGVGKTVLLDRMREEAESVGIHALRIEAPEGRSLPALLAPQLGIALLKLSRNAQAKRLAQHALRALAGFAKALKVKYHDIEVGIDFEPEARLADNGDLEQDLQMLLEAVGSAARKAGSALVIFISAVLILGQATTAMAQTAVKHFPASSAALPAGAVSPTGVPAFSSAVMAGNTLYVSGTIDIDPATGKPPTDVKAGAKLVLDNIKRTVEGAGLTMDDLVWVQVFATDLANYAIFNEVYRSYFTGPLPARAFIGAGSLLAGSHFEVMGIAVKPKK